MKSVFLDSFMRSNNGVKFKSLSIPTADKRRLGAVISSILKKN